MKKTAVIETPLGKLLATGDDEYLYSLEFANGKETGKTATTKLIAEELKAYFAGKLKSFKTPLFFSGTPFQKKVWQALCKIPIGKTCSYKELAESIHHPTSFRAAANANGKNRFVIIVPCHRVINSDGKMGGYSSGLKRKEWLLNHEKMFR